VSGQLHSLSVLLPGNGPRSSLDGESDIVYKMVLSVVGSYNGLKCRNSQYYQFIRKWMKISLRSLWQLPGSGRRAFWCSGCWRGVVLWNALIGLDGVFYKVPTGLRHRSQERALGSGIPKPRLVTYTWIVNMHFVLLAFTSCPAPLVVTHKVVCYLRGSFQMFCTLYIFSLKMNLFY